MVTRFLGRIFTGPDARLAEIVSAQPAEPTAMPAEITLGTEVFTLRLMGPADAAAILRFGRALPDHDLLFLRRDITDATQVDAWLHEISEGQTTTALAVRDGEVLGYATVASDGLAWTRHVRELRVLVAPSMRGKRLGRFLTEQAFAIANEQGAKKMVAQMTSDQRAAIEIFRSMGFSSEARLRRQVIDREGHLHDLEIMSLDVDAFEAKLDLVYRYLTPEFV